MLLTPETFLALIRECEDTVTLTEGDEPIHFLNSKRLAESLQTLIDARPKNRFAVVVGQTPEAAQELLDGRSPYELSLSPIRKVVVFLRDGNMTPALMERAARVRGTSGMFDGRGMANDDELPVVEIDGIITEILDFAR